MLAAPVSWNYLLDSQKRLWSYWFLEQHAHGEVVSR